MHLIAKIISISHAKFHCNRLTTVQDIQDYTSLIFVTHTSVYTCSITHVCLYVPYSTFGVLLQKTRYINSLLLLLLSTSLYFSKRGAY